MRAFSDFKRFERENSTGALLNYVFKAGDKSHGRGSDTESDCADLKWQKMSEFARIIWLSKL